MAKQKSKITYKEFMRQLDKVKLEMGRDMYERLADKFAKTRTHKTA